MKTRAGLQAILSRMGKKESKPSVIIGAVVLLLAAVTGCDGNRATGPYFEESILPNFDEAIVYFYRSPGSEAPKSSDWIHAFDTMIRLDEGGYSFHIVPPGRYRISLYSQADGSGLSFNLRRGQTAFFKWSTVRKGQGYESKMMAVDEPQALRELPGCRLMQLDPGGRP